MSAPPLLVPPRPPVPIRNLGFLGALRALRTNALTVWPEAAYEQDVLVQGFLGRRRFLLNAAEPIRHVLVDNAGNYRRSPATIRILRPLLGEGLFLSEGEEWKHQRRTVAPALVPRVLPLLCRHIAVAAAASAARFAALQDRPVDLLAALQFLALEIAGRSMFSLEMGEYGAELRGFIARFAADLGRPYFLDMILPPSVPTPRDMLRRRYRARWLDLIDRMIAARLRAAPPDEPRDLFDLLRVARDPETGQPFSPTQLRDQVATMIVAGHETTGLVLFWSLYLLASAPAEQERVAAESRALDLGAEAAYAALPRLARTRAVVDETLRLYPPAFAIVREAIAADRCGDLAIAPRSLVMVAPWVLHRHRKLWQNPDAFDPSRFLQGVPHGQRLAYLPFGIGPRVCVGAQFALAEATLVLAIFVGRYRIVQDDAAPVLPVAVVTTQPDRAARFRLSPRDG